MPSSLARDATTTTVCIGGRRVSYCMGMNVRWIVAWVEPKARGRHRALASVSVLLLIRRYRRFFGKSIWKRLCIVYCVLWCVPNDAMPQGERINGSYREAWHTKKCGSCVYGLQKLLSTSRYLFFTFLLSETTINAKNVYCAMYNIWRAKGNAPQEYLSHHWSHRNIVYCFIHVPHMYVGTYGAECGSRTPHWRNGNWCSRLYWNRNGNDKQFPLFLVFFTFVDILIFGMVGPPYQNSKKRLQAGGDGGRYKRRANTIKYCEGNSLYSI